MHCIRRGLAAAGGVALCVLSLAAPAADVDPPLPLAVKQRLIDITTAPTSSRGRCIDGDAIRALISTAPAYTDEITLFASHRLQERPSRSDDDCSCLIELARAIGSALPDRSTSLAKSVAAQAPAACGILITRGIDEARGGGDGTSNTTGEGRPSSGEAVARNSCAASRACATPLLRPHTDLIGPTRLGDNS